MTYRAMYMTGSIEPPYSKGHFETEEDAWEWVLRNKMCELCNEELAGYEAGLPEDEEKGIFYSPFPACAVEWMVFDEDEEAREEWHKNGGETIMSLESYINIHKNALDREAEEHCKKVEELKG